MTDVVNDRKEINEAIVAGDMALKSLYAAQEKLDSAKGWSWLDLFGGGFFTDMIKHSKMEEAFRFMENAKYNLKIFQRELSDVHLSLDLRMEVGGFLSFADFFFDGIIADYLMQTKIADARDEVENAIYQVQQVLNELRAEYNRIS